MDEDSTRFEKARTRPILSVGKSVGFVQDFRAETFTLQGARLGALVGKGSERVGPVEEPVAAAAFA
jgi:hypothetical protein